MLQSPRITRDEKDVSAVDALIENWNNPFEGSQDLASISTAKETPEGVSYDFINGFDFGEQEWIGDSRRKGLKAPHQEKRFHDPIKLQKLKTFTPLSNKKAVTTQGRTMILKADRDLF